MHVEKVACPKCNSLVWINVPDDKEIDEVGYSFILGSDATQSCPECRIEIQIRYRYD